MAQAPGYDKLTKWTDCPIMPTPGAVGEIIKKISEKDNISVVGVDIGGATTDVFSVFDGQFNRTVSANYGMSYSICNVLADAGIENVSRWIFQDLDENNLTNRIANKMIRPTTIPQTLEDLTIEQAIAREALRLSFDQHKKFAVSLKGIQQERTISDTFEQKMTGETLVDLSKLDMIVGSGGVLSHAPRREQAFRMLVDSFLPEDITQVAVDSIFMMPQLGVLSSIHEKAAIEVFNKDCLVRLGSCIAPIGNANYGDAIMDYSLNISGDIKQGTLKVGELLLIPADFNAHQIEINCHKNFTINDENQFSGTIFGGDVGILLDGRGRAFNLTLKTENRLDLIKSWSKNTNEYPFKGDI